MTFELASLLKGILQLIVNLIPFAVVIFLAITAWKVRLLYLRSKYISKIEWVLLEIKVPREVHKSPQAMEFIMNAMFQTFPVHWHDVYFKGIVRAWFSLEIVSIEGKIYFLMYVPKFFQKLIESQIYSQYPRVEINEIQDYAKMIPPYKKGGSFKLYGYEFGPRKPYSWPIKTYIDYGLDKAVGSLEDIEKIDPLATVIEFLGSIGPGEQIWLQILIQGSTEPWKKAGQKLIDGLKVPYESKKEEGKRRPFIITRDIQSGIDAIDRKISKVGFDCGIRGLYIAERDVYSIPTQVAMRGILNAFGSESLNSFRRPLSTAFNFPWKQLLPFRVEWRKDRIFKAYQQRSFFNFPYWLYFFPFEAKPFILNTEELATLYHFPGMITETPTFRRIEFKKAEPPPDLPI